MTVDYQFCEKHPKEPVQYCSLCLLETRIKTREECADLAHKMERYRELMTGQKRDTSDWPPDPSDSSSAPEED